MAEIDSSHLIGEVTLDSDATIVVGGNNAVVPAGTYYLIDPTNSLSLIYQAQTAIAAHYAGSTVTILKNRKVKFDFNGNSVTLVIPSALQEILGFDSSPYTAATSRTAEDISTLLWSPGWPERTIGHPVGTEGYIVPNWQQTSSPSGQTIRTTVHGTDQVLTELGWSMVKQARVWTTGGGLGGEYRRFFGDVLKPGHRWKIYSNVAEDESSSSAISYGTPFGPYKMRDPDWQWWNRGIASVDRFTNISLKGTLTAEIS